MPATLTGWILFATIMFAAARTIAGGIKLTLAMLGQANGDRRDLHKVYAFGTLLMLSTLLFLFVEVR